MNTIFFFKIEHDPILAILVKRANFRNRLQILADCKFWQPIIEGSLWSKYCSSFMYCSFGIFCIFLIPTIQKLLFDNPSTVLLTTIEYNSKFCQNPKHWVIFDVDKVSFYSYYTLKGHLT